MGQWNRISTASPDCCANHRHRWLLVRSPWPSVATYVTLMALMALMALLAGGQSDPSSLPRAVSPALPFQVDFEARANDDSPCRRWAPRLAEMANLQGFQGRWECVSSPAPKYSCKIWEWNLEPIQGTPLWGLPCIPAQPLSAQSNRVQTQWFLQCPQAFPTPKTGGIC